MHRQVRAPRLALLCLAIAGVAALGSAPVGAQATPALGYFRQPALWNDTLVFTAEGDLWRVPPAPPYPTKRFVPPAGRQPSSRGPTGAEPR